MMIFNQWRGIRHGVFGIALFCAYRTEDFWGFVICGFTFEFPRTALARDIHHNIGSVVS